MAGEQASSSTGFLGRNPIVSTLWWPW